MKQSRDEALIPQDELSRYFAEIGQYPLLTREEETELATRVHESGDPEAAQKLVVDPAEFTFARPLGKFDQ